MVALARQLSRCPLEHGARQSLGRGRPPLPGCHLLVPLHRHPRRPGQAHDFVPALLGGILLFRLTANLSTRGGRSIRNSKDLMLSWTFPRALLQLQPLQGPAQLRPDGLRLRSRLHPFVCRLSLAVAAAPALRDPGRDDVGSALLVSTAAVFVKDTQNALSYISRVLFFTTPVIYPVSLIPAEFRTCFIPPLVPALPRPIRRLSVGRLFSGSSRRRPAGRSGSSSSAVGCSSDMSSDGVTL